MDKTITEIRFFAPGISYGTEMVHNASPQAAINILKARVPNAQIVTIKYHTVTEGRDGRKDTIGRR
jgi:hypothetical protein